MARKISDTVLDTKTARGKLKPRAWPYYRTVEPGLALGYLRLDEPKLVPIIPIIRAPISGQHVKKRLANRLHSRRPSRRR
jgi:hypothetical protein